VPVVDHYLKLMEVYLQYQNKSSLIPFTRKAAAQRLADEAVRSLDQLDMVRALIRPIQKPIIAGKR